MKREVLWKEGFVLIAICIMILAGWRLDVMERVKAAENDRAQIAIAVAAYQAEYGKSP